jgi:hypothetical protein
MSGSAPFWNAATLKLSYHMHLIAFIEAEIELDRALEFGRVAEKT